MSEITYANQGNILYILNILKKHSDDEHPLSAEEIGDLVDNEYDVKIEQRTVRRNIELLIQKFKYDIETVRAEKNKKLYYINRDPETDFEPGEIRAIIDNFSYASYIVPSIADGIIKKCKSIQTKFENDKIKNYRIYSARGKTKNAEVIKNIEDISECIMTKNKIKFEYWKYNLEGDSVEKNIVSEPTVSPYAIVYDKQQFYVIAIKNGEKDFFRYRLDRIKNLKMLEEKITLKRSEKDIADYAESSVEAFGGKGVEIQAICDKILVDEVIEKFGKNVKIEPQSKDKFKMTLDVTELGFKMWAMRNLDLCTVIKPKSLVNEIKNVIEEAQTRYK